MLDQRDEVLDWRYDLPNVLFLTTNLRPDELSQMLDEIGGKNGRYIVTEISEKRQGRLSTEAWKMINQSEDYDPTREKDETSEEEWQKLGMGFKENRERLATDIRARIDSIKVERLGWNDTVGTTARKWWNAFEEENEHRLGLVLRLAEELAKRQASITEFFLAYVYSNTDNILANLHYLDYTRLKKEEERKKREAAEKSEDHVEAVHE